MGYIAKVLFVIVVAVAFHYRNEIMEKTNKMFGSQPTPSPGPAGGQEEERQASTPAPPREPLKPPDPDYYNPPYDPSNPPEPIFTKSGTRMITKNELAAHGPSDAPVWLAILGMVFDVDKGAEHYYGKEGGYKFFSGIDGTKAFVTGEFDEKGLIEDITGLTPIQVGELEDWVKFYQKDYTFVGKLIGRYYTKDGSPTKAWYQYQRQLGEKDKVRAEQRKLEQRYPGCNSQWSEATKGRMYCSEKSGGVTRDWVGYPRRFFAPGMPNQWRCACIKKEDLNSPHLKPYPDCDPDSHECKVDPEQIKAMRARGE